MKAQFEFAKMGATLDPAPGKIALDVGNSLQPGVIDHHHLDSETCATQLLLDNPHCLTPWIPRAGNAYTIVLHDSPDFDCICAAYLAVEYVEKGTFPPGAQALARYACQIDQGFSTQPDPANPKVYEVFEAIKERVSRADRGELHTLRAQAVALHDDNDRETLRVKLEQAHARRNTRVVENGLKLIGFVLDRTPEPAPQDAFECVFREKGHPFEEEVEELNKDLQLYLDDLRDRNRIRMMSVPLPRKGMGSAVLTDALCYRDPRPLLFKLWARADKTHSPSGAGFSLMLVIWSDGCGEHRTKPRYVISVDPASGVDLRGLGDVLNAAEDKVLREKGVPQKGPSRPGYSLPDPWYDGRDHGFTIVDTPHDGTHLDEEEISLILHRFMDLAAFRCVSVDEAACRIVVVGGFDPATRIEKRRKLREQGWEHETDESLSPAFADYLFGEENPRNRQLLFLRKQFAPQDTGNTGCWVASLEAALHSHGVAVLSLEIRFRSRGTDELCEWNSMWREGVRLDHFVSANENGIRGLRDASSQLAFFELPSPSIAFTYWSVRFQDAHLPRDQGFYERLLATYVARETTPGAIVKSDAEAARQCLELGNFARVVVLPDGAFLFLNETDFSMPEKEEKNLLAAYQTTCWHLFLNSVVQKAALDRLIVGLSKTAYENLESKKLSERLQLLRERSVDLATRSVTYNLTKSSLGRAFWDRVGESMKLVEIRENVIRTINDLAAYESSVNSKKREDQMFFLQIVFVMGVLASLLALGAMPGGKLISYGPTRELIAETQLEAFSWVAFFQFALPVLALSFVLFYVLKLAIEWGRAIWLWFSRRKSVSDQEMWTR